MTRPPWGGVAMLLTVAAMAAPAFAPNVQANSAPVVTNVTAQQIQGTGQVRITFDVSDADGDPVAVRLICSSDNGITFDLSPISVTGDANHPIAPGTGKEIIWDATRDYPGRYWAQVVAKVVASDGPVAAGEMILVPGGAFYMGSTSGPADEQPQHAVYLDPYYIDKYEVTNAAFQAFIESGGYNNQAFWSAEGWTYRQSFNWTEPQNWSNPPAGRPLGPGYPGFPVVGVSWYEAEAYANFAGKRLPTEAEWEKAGRAPDTRIYPWGNQTPTSDRANYQGSADPFPQSTPVGFYNGQLFQNPPFQTTDSPGPLGTYDQAGNVWEWVRDWYDPGYYAVSPTSNPQGPQTGGQRVIRGGSWEYDYYYPQSDEQLRVAKRTFQLYRGSNGTYFSGSPVERTYYVGFRCARSGP